MALWGQQGQGLCSSGGPGSHGKLSRGCPSGPVPTVSPPCPRAQVVRSAATSGAGSTTSGVVSGSLGSREVNYILRVLGPAACRSPHVFTEVATGCIRIALPAPRGSGTGEGHGGYWGGSWCLEQAPREGLGPGRSWRGLGGSPGWGPGNWGALGGGNGGMGGILGIPGTCDEVLGGFLEGIPGCLYPHKMGSQGSLRAGVLGVPLSPKTEVPQVPLCPKMGSQGPFILREEVPRGPPIP